MKKIIFTTVFLFAYTAWGVTLSIIGPCSATPEYKSTQALLKPTTVGQFTIEFLDNNQIPYVGSEEGLNSILNTPYDKKAIEVLGENEMRAYGWCYSVDGLEPAVMPHEFELKGDETVIWWYAFSHWKAGQWLTYCTPAHSVAQPQLCPKN